MSAEKTRSETSGISVIRGVVFRRIAVLLLGLVPVATSGFAHARKAPDPAKDAPSTEQAPVRAFPKVALGDGEQLQYVGSFSADGKFKPLTKLGLFVDSMVTSSLSGQPPAAPPPAPAELIEQDPTNQVPPNIELHRDEQFVEDFQPPEHAVKVAKGHSVLQELRDSVVSLAYGSEKVLVMPQAVTTDSRQRVIVTDAAVHGLHVLAYSPKDSFQIVGGPGRRLQSPSGVAVDANDNIYVSDSERGVVLVYDSQGVFVRTIGVSEDEGLFEHPTGIAIDRKAGHLYVLDPPRHVLFILDLEGKVLARVGSNTANGFSSRTGSTEPGQFKDPIAVLVHDDELIVLDATRIHLFDLHGKFLKEFKLSNDADLHAGTPPGLFMDAENHIYISSPGAGMVRMYNHDGQFLRAFGRPGARMGEFNVPAGMWADSTGRVYIVDARRVQVFQFAGAK